MAKFPQSPIPSFPLPWKVTRPIAKGGSAWNPVTRAKTRFDCYGVAPRYEVLEWSDVQILHEFWNGVGGPNGIFTFVDYNGWDLSPVGVSWLNLYVGVGDGLLQSWDLPIYDGSSFVMYEDGSEISSSDYEINAGSVKGVEGVDRVTFDTAPADGVIIAVSATGLRALPYARFLDEEFPFSWTDPEITQAGALNILEVRLDTGIEAGLGSTLGTLTLSATGTVV